MPLYDFRCDKCKHEWDAMVPALVVKRNAPECPECGSNFTNQVWLKAPSSDRAKDPYDMLNRYRPDRKPIKSFANDKRKGGKDTT